MFILIILEELDWGFPTGVIPAEAGIHRLR